jgi:hypothetical protein
VKNWDTVSAGAVKAFNAIKTAVTTSIDWVIRKVKEAIEWFKKLLQSIPVIGGLFGGSQMAPSGAAFYAPASLVGVAPRLTTHSSSRAAGGGGITVNVTGALDPVAVARQIRALLLAQDRRTGGVTA